MEQSYMVTLGELATHRGLCRFPFPRTLKLSDPGTGSGMVGEWGLGENRNRASDKGVGKFQRWMVGKATQPCE